MGAINRIKGSRELEAIQQAVQVELDKLHSLLLRPLGAIKGPYDSDCRARLDELVLLEPRADMSVFLQGLTPAHSGRIITIVYNSDADHTVTIHPATSSETIDGLTSKTIDVRKQYILVATSNKTWIVT